MCCVMPIWLVSKSQFPNIPKHFRDSALAITCQPPCFFLPQLKNPLDKHSYRPRSTADQGKQTAGLCKSDTSFSFRMKLLSQRLRSVTFPPWLHLVCNNRLQTFRQRSIKKVKLFSSKFTKVLIILLYNYIPLRTNEAVKIQSSVYHLAIPLNVGYWEPILFDIGWWQCTLWTGNQSKADI